MNKQKILITGAAGFIGFHTAKQFLVNGVEVIGLDNLNDYYEVSLKQARLKQLDGKRGFTFLECDISDRQAMEKIAKDNADITHVIHLAAQAGVRYSLQNPYAYVQSNLMGQVVVLEICRNNLPNLEHLIYASSSSVYGGNEKQPFAVDDRTDTPVSLYAATKKADELMTHTYSHLYGVPATGLRFFTVYGPWGRPDMAYFFFTQHILEGKPIKIFNNGDLKRDFTYIDDIVAGITAVSKKAPEAISVPHKVYNLGNNKPVKIPYFIDILEDAIGKKAVREMVGMQQGDVKETYADITESISDFGYQPNISIEEGLPKFIEWFKQYY